LFPTPAALVRANLDGLGITGTRVAALRSLARAVLDGRVDFSAASADVATALAALPGVGPWTAQYVALRALGEPDALPYGDWVLRRMAARGAAPLTAQQLEQRSETWRPWRSYATVYLWQAAGQLAARKQVARIRRAAAASTSASVHA
jgi:AraC family transcriptional regulator of adaptative response / DNA-3-methyladenine glycosylase II